MLGTEAIAKVFNVRHFQEARNIISAFWPFVILSNPLTPYFIQGATANTRVGVQGHITGGETSSVLLLNIRLPLSSCRFPTLGAMASDKLHTLQGTHNIPWYVIQGSASK